MVLFFYGGRLIEPNRDPTWRFTFSVFEIFGVDQYDSICKESGRRMIRPSGIVLKSMRSQVKMWGQLTYGIHLIQVIHKIPFPQVHCNLKQTGKQGIKRQSESLCTENKQINKKLGVSDTDVVVYYNHYTLLYNPGTLLPAAHTNAVLYMHMGIIKQLRMQ